MDTAVHDLEIARSKANSTWINDIVSKDLLDKPIYTGFNTHSLDNNDSST